MTTEGTFILADIGGYTGFLTGVGIEHGKEITSDLFNVILKCNRGRWKLANVEGDCLFFYREGREPPDELLDHVRLMYTRFSGRIIDIAARASCPCGACTRTNQLSLKFIVHAGGFDTQRIGNRTELIGPDVVVAHRLLKNSVPLAEYALLTSAYTDGAVPGARAATLGRDEYDDIGPVEYACVDLSALRQEIEARNRVFLTEEQARISAGADIEAPPDAVWQAVLDKEARLTWQGLKEIEEWAGRSERVGKVHRCVTSGGGTIVGVATAVDEENRRLTEKSFASRLVRDCYITMGVDPRGTGSRFYLRMIFEPGIPAVSHILMLLMRPVVRREMQQMADRLKAYCESNAVD